MTWPWPADTGLDRARRVAQWYRHALGERAPGVCEQIDEMARRFGQTWALPTTQVYVDDDLLTAELAADLMHVQRRTIYHWRERGLRVTSTPDGPRYRVRDLTEFDAHRRRKRA